VLNDSLVVTTSSGQRETATALVESAEINGVQLTPLELHQAIAERIRLETSTLPENTFAPPPLLSATGSFLLPGSGQAMLGDWPNARGYLAADVLLLGLGSYLMFVQKDRGAALPLFGLDLIFRTASAAEAYRASRRRRALLARRELAD
jgi:hypothetical protein